MKRNMRRCDREINDFSKIESFLKSLKTCRMAMIDGDEPYVVPMNFGYHDRKVYMHGAKEGKKLRVLQKNPRVCLEWDREGNLIDHHEDPCRWGMKFTSVIGWGNASILIEEKEKVEALRLFMTQFSDKPDWEFNPTMVKNTLVIVVELDKVSGKEFS